MQVNTEVYGAASTWSRDTGFTTSATTPAEFQFKKGQYSTLEEYDSHGLNLIGEHIDYSICYAGQAPGLPLSSMKTWDLSLVDNNWIMTMYSRNTPTGWFFGHQNSGVIENSNKLYPSNAILLRDVEHIDAIKLQNWLPSGTMADYPDQPSARIIPIVEFNPKACYFGIKVTIFNGSTGSLQDKWLDELRTGDWSAWKIVHAHGVLYTFRNSNTDFAPAAISSSESCTVCMDKELDFVSEDNSAALKVLSYSLLCKYYIPIYGWISVFSSVNVSGTYHCLARAFYSQYDPSACYAPIFIDSLPSTTFNKVTYTNWGIAPEGYAAINEDNLESLRRAAAAYGLFFTEKDPELLKANANRWIDNTMFLGVLEDGIGRGDYTQGAGNADNDIFGWNSSQRSGYDPSKTIDPNVYSNVTAFNTLDTNAALTKFYVLDKTNVEKLGDDLWTICADLSVDDYTDFEGKVKDEFLTSNPIDSIISLKRFPFDVPHTFSNSKVNVKLGKSEGTAQGYRTFNVVFGVNYKGIDIYPQFGNSFLDYSPYTSYELYIPFCGTVDIDPGDILGHTLNLRLRIDLFTGSVVAYIMADELVIGTANGNCALDQVLSGTQSATVYSNIINGILTYNSIQDTRTNTTAELIYPTGWIKGALSPFSYAEKYDQLNIQEQKQEADLTHIIAPTHKMGTASPMLAWIQEFNARLMIYYPEGSVINRKQPPSFIPAALASFGHLKGFATVSPGTVSSFRKIGKQCFLRGDILADSIPCTDNERKRIRAAFADGVFLPALTE